MKPLSTATFLITLLVASQAFAQSGDADQKREAAEHYRIGKAHFDAGEWDEAVAEYETAYQLVPEPVLLFNIGLALRSKGDKQGAVHYFERYLDLEGVGEVADEARDYIRDLRAALAAERPRPATPPPEPAPPAPPVEPVDAPPPHSGRGLRIAGLVTAGVGVIALAVSAKFASDISAAEDAIDTELAMPVPSPEVVRGHYDEGESAERKFATTAIIGGTLVVAGAVVYVIGMTRSGKDEKQVALSPVVSPDGAGLAVLGRF